MRAVYYSLVHLRDSPCEDQWIQSIRSLRLHNAAIPVHLFTYNSSPVRVLKEAQRWGVIVHPLGNYREFLARIYPKGAALGAYPTFHKFLSLRDGSLEGASQILYLDCDTFVWQDVSVLFDQYRTHDWYAREEPGAPHSYLGHDQDYINQKLLETIAHSEALRPVPPFNSGVCILNNGVWHGFDHLSVTYLDLAWRLLVGWHVSRPSCAPGERDIGTAIMQAVTEADRSRALPFPSNTDWIVEQIALWLALGSLPRLSIGVIQRDHVAQNGEFVESLQSKRKTVLTHYYRGLEDAFFSVVGRLE